MATRFVRKISPNVALTMQIVLNGEPRTVIPGLSVAGLLAEIGIDARKVAVERNLEIVPKSAFAATALTEGDRLEIVHFIGGG
jgi:thiamine biosynthesis protein ThiS